MRKLLGYARIFYEWRIRKNPDPGYLPEDISLELTNTCNFKCSFCPQSDPEHFNIVTRSTLHPERAETIFHKLREGGVKTDVIHWTLDGEPFVNREIDEITERAIAHGWRHFIFATNGFFCSLDRVRALPRGDGNISYTFSIDYCSDREMFEKNRGTPTSWERVGKNIADILGAEDLAHISIKVTDISSFELDDRDELLHRFRALRDLLPDSDRLKVTSRIFHNMTGHVMGVLERKRSKASGYNLCPYPWTSLVVASNGEVVACCRDLQHKTVLGNLFEEDLKPIWNGPRYREFRQALVDARPGAMAACANCDLPYDQGKFRVSHIVRRGVDRLGIFR